MRVLVVDDDDVHADFVASLLLRQGHSALAITSARAALRRLAGDHFDAIVMDVVMPEMDGIELLRELRRHHPALPVICMTGSAWNIREGLERLIEIMGAICLLRKPLDPVALRTALSASN